MYLNIEVSVGNVTSYDDWQVLTLTLGRFIVKHITRMTVRHSQINRVRHNL